ncbi:hypothetical protein COLO4_29559 [Corchorus olitorius]|uniref:Leucine-rich repeat-containing N-terminal plant-type domain-containing protein n=1 Tax=Corchorus olitorius TaxID=93759 RepID=A0A1R3HE49_9ROSI|nr:hypothetical protein COLO4_29559 [Corchorus olitorius]
MKHTCFSFFFQVILLLWKSSCLETFGNESDRLALLDFKSQVTHDPHNVMASWNNSLHFCSWFGVTCSPSIGRVVILNLEAQSLVGSIPPSIGNLTFLTGINLEGNSFHGEIPQERPENTFSCSQRVYWENSKPVYFIIQVETFGVWS